MLPDPVDPAEVCTAKTSIDCLLITRVAGACLSHVSMLSEMLSACTAWLRTNQSLGFTAAESNANQTLRIEVKVLRYTAPA